MPIEVVALEDGHHGTYRWKGDKFTVQKAPAKYTWFVPVEPAPGASYIFVDGKHIVLPSDHDSTGKSKPAKVQKRRADKVDEGAADEIFTKEDLN